MNMQYEIRPKEDYFKLGIYCDPMQDAMEISWEVERWQEKQEEEEERENRPLWEKAAEKILETILN